MRKKLVLIILNLLLLKATAQDTIYQIDIGHSLQNNPSFISKLPNTTFLIGGYIRYYLNPTSTYIKSALLKANENGIIEWEKQYHLGQGYLMPVDLQSSNDTSIVLLNYYDGVTVSSMLMRIDSVGNIINQTGYNEGMSSIKKDKLTDSYWIAGAISRNQTIYPPYDINVYKIDSLFQPIWSYTYQYPTGTYYNTLKIAPSMGDGVVLAASYLDTLPNSPSYMIIMKLDTGGNVLWSYKYAQGPLTTFDDIKSLPDGGYVIAGGGSLPNQYTGFLFKIDSLGNIVWSQVYSMNGECNSVSFTSDGGYIVSGWLFTGLTFLLKTDSIGTPQWLRYSGHSGPPVGAEQTADGGYMYADVAGNNVGNLVLHICKTDSAGNMGCDDNAYTITSQSIMVSTPITFTRSQFQITMSATTIQMDTTPIPDSVLCAGVSGIAQHAEKEEALSIYPNPTNDFCIVFAKVFLNTTITLYDITGRILLTKEFNEKTELNISSFKPGIYFVEVGDKKGKSLKGKILKQ